MHWRWRLLVLSRVMSSSLKTPGRLRHAQHRQVSQQGPDFLSSQTAKEPSGSRRMVQQLNSAVNSPHSVYGRQDGLNAMMFKTTVLHIDIIAPHAHPRDLVAASNLLYAFQGERRPNLQREALTSSARPSDRKEGVSSVLAASLVTCLMHEPVPMRGTLVF